MQNVMMFNVSKSVIQDGVELPWNCLVFITALLQTGCLHLVQ